MLTHPTWDTRHALRLTGLAKALREQRNFPESQTRSVAERLGLLVDRERTERCDRRLPTRLRQAKLRLSACLEALDSRHPRGRDTSLRLGLASCQWVKERHKVLITGPTGVGKPWVACALGHQACRAGYSVLYRRLPRLLQELSLAKGDGRYPKLMASLAKTAVLILDAWGRAPLNDENRHDVLERLADRHGRGATPVTSQFPVDHWHEALGHPTLADAILDRLLPHAYKMHLRGDAMRKRHAAVTNAVTAMLREKTRRRCAPMGVAAFVWIGWQASAGLGGSCALD